MKVMREELFHKSRQVEISKFDDTEFYDNYTLAMNNSDTRAINVLNTFISLINNIIKIISTIAVIVYVDWIIIIAVSINVMLNFIINFRLSRLSYYINLESVKSNRIISYISRVYYLKSYAKELRTSNVNKSLKHHFDSAVVHAEKIIKKYSGKQISNLTLQNIFQIIAQFAIQIHLILRAVSNKITIGDFAMILNASNQLSGSILNFLNTFPKLYENSLYIEKFRNFVEYSSGNDRRVELYEINSIDSIEFRNVRYIYNNDKLEHVLDSINLKIFKGEKIAILGLNGSGKSTFVKLLLGLYSPSEGEVFLNGQNYNLYDSNVFLGNIGVVFQDFEFFAIPIIENILMRPVIDKENDEKLVKSALVKVGMYEKICSLPEGVYTNISKELDSSGTTFSGGEFQRLAISRILTKHYQFIVLDEPTSNLDIIGERKIMNLVFNEYKDEAVIVISHKIQYLSQFDHVYVFDKGNIEEYDRKLELVEN